MAQDFIYFYYNNFYSNFYRGILLHDANDSFCNIVSNRLWANGYYGIGIGDGHNNRIMSNIIYDNHIDGIGYYQSGPSNEIYRNLIYGNSNCGINLANASIDNIVVNNTIFNNFSNGIWLSGTASAEIFNNIIYSN